MQGILYISHGSRIKEATSEAMACITAVKQQINIPLQAVCFLELAEPNVSQGIDYLVSKGATRIAVVPVLLLRAGHYYKDIPQAITHAKKKYERVTFTIGQPLGVQDRLIDILVERIEETEIKVKKDAKILVIGRGSHHPETKKNIEYIGKKLQEKTNVSCVEVCFLAACEPSFDQAFQSSLKGNNSQIFIVPYLWFTGILVHSIKQKINETTHTNKDIVLCQYLSDHPTMKQALKERVYESFKNGENYISIL